MIDAETNRRIGRRAPSDLLEMEGKFEEGGSSQLLSQILTSHILPAEGDSSLRRDEFDRFISWRQARLARAVRDVTGSVAAVEDEDELDVA